MKTKIKHVHSVDNHRSVKPKPQGFEPYTPVKVKDDYNSKLRIARQQREEESGIKHMPNLIKSVVKNIENDHMTDDPSEYLALKDKVKVIEEQALMKEKILDSRSNDIEAYGEVNDMLITSIKAKLALLKGV